MKEAPFLIVTAAISLIAIAAISAAVAAFALWLLLQQAPIF
jgi:hypothetical protein